MELSVFSELTCWLCPGPPAPPHTAENRCSRSVWKGLSWATSARPSASSPLAPPARSLTWPWWQTWARRRENEMQLQPEEVCDTHFMCFTALEPTLSATNSTVRRSDGGWLWKKACSRSTCHAAEQSQSGDGGSMPAFTAAMDSPAASAGTCWESTRPWAQPRWGWSSGWCLRFWPCSRTQTQPGAYGTHLHEYKRHRCDSAPP